MTDTQTDVEPYAWMFDWDHDHDSKRTGIASHNAWLFKDVREAYEDLRETANAFRLSTLLPDDIDYNPHNVGSMLHYLGSWQMPDRFTQSRAVKWVNHEGRWAEKYSDAAVVCQCGATKHRIENVTCGTGFDEEHADDCTPVQSYRTKMVMWQRRDRILRQSALNHLYRREVGARLGVGRDTVAQQCQMLGIDYDGLQTHGYRKWRATMLLLEERFNISQADLARVFGLPPTTLREHLYGNLQPYQDQTTSPEHGVISND